MQDTAQLSGESIFFPTSVNTQKYLILYSLFQSFKMMETV